MLLKTLLQEIKSAQKDPKVLYKNEWVSLMMVNRGKEDYVYSHETRCNGNIIAVIPYRRVGKDGWEYAIRQENVPAWGTTKHMTALTGGVDKGDTPKSTAIKELMEEAGIGCKESDLESLGTCNGTKSTDTTYHLFAIDVSKAGVTTKEPTEKGTGEMVWMYPDKIKKEVTDPIFYVMFCRLGFY